MQRLLHAPLQCGLLRLLDAPALVVLRGVSARLAPIALDGPDRLCKLERLRLLDELAQLALAMRFAALIAEQSGCTAQLLDFNQRAWLVVELALHEYRGLVRLADTICNRGSGLDGFGRCVGGFWRQPYRT